MTYGLAAGPTSGQPADARSDQFARSGQSGIGALATGRIEVGRAKRTRLGAAQCLGRPAARGLVTRHPAR